MSHLLPVRLVPVEVFGAGLCGEDCAHCETHEGYGLSDAVSPWSDCNRAIGRVYRVDDLPAEHRQPGETVTVYVDVTGLAWFDRLFASEDES